MAACESVFRSTNDPTAGIRFARAAFYLGQHDVVEKVASTLLSTEARFDAYSFLGWIEVAREHGAIAIYYLTIAKTGHTHAADLPAAARDAHQLAGAFSQRGSYQRALDALDLARGFAVGDVRMSGSLALGRANLLRILGNLKQAERALDDAMGFATEPEDQILVSLQQGILYLEAGPTWLARSKLVETLAAERARPNPREFVIQSALLNLAYVERMLKNLQAADDDIEATLATHVDPMSYRLNRGLVRADQNRLPEAAADLAAAEAQHPTGVWSWWVPYHQALVAARSGNLADAEGFDRVAIERMTDLATRVGPVGASLIASNRGPFEHLIGIAARAGRWTDVVEIVAMMDSADVLTASDRPPVPTPPDIAVPADLPPRKLLHVAAGEIATAWKGTRLEIVVGDSDDSVWRIDIDHEHVTGSRVGSVARLTELAHRLETTMADGAAASVLGEALLPVLDPRDPVAVLAVGPLAETPIPLLRVGGALAVTRVSIARATRLTPGTAHSYKTTKVVLGDARGDLQHARNEVQALAHSLGVTPLVVGAATRAAVRSAAGGELLHASVHASAAGLQLADGTMKPEDIAMLPSPRLVVLAACASGTGADPMGTGSLADAYLSGGAQVVIATTRAVDDAKAHELIAAFYREGGASQPVAALAKAQRELASSMSPDVWAAFEARLGRPSR